MPIPMQQHVSWLLVAVTKHLRHVWRVSEFTPWSPGSCFVWAVVRQNIVKVRACDEGGFWHRGPQEAERSDRKRPARICPLLTYTQWPTSSNLASSVSVLSPPNSLLRSWIHQWIKLHIDEVRAILIQSTLETPSDTSRGVLYQSPRCLSV